MRRLALVGLLFCGLVAWLAMLRLEAAQNSPPAATAADAPQDAARPDYPLPLDPDLPPEPVAPPSEAQLGPPVPVAAPNPSAALPADSLPMPADPAATGIASRLGKVQHLLRAAAHLEAAGLTEQAAALRRQAAQEELVSLLAQKRGELKKLQAEIERIETTLNGGQQIMLAVKVLDVSHAKLRAAAFELDPSGVVELVTKTAECGDKTHLGVMDAEKLNELMTLLKKADALKVIAEPRLLTTSGKAASCFIGGEVPAVILSGKDRSVEHKKFGLLIDLLPCIAGECLRLELRPRLTPVASGSRSGAGCPIHVGSFFKDRAVAEFDVGIAVRPGQTVIVSCGRGETKTSQTPQTGAGQESSQASQDDEELLILVTPTLVDPSEGPATPRGPVADRPDASPAHRGQR